MDDRIEELLSKKADGELSLGEERELAAWMQEAKERVVLLKDYLRVRRWMETGRDYAPDANRGFLVWKRRCRRKRIARVVRYAAVFVCVLACGLGIWEYNRSESAEKKEILLAGIAEDGGGVFFEWADGRRTSLAGEIRDSVLAERAGVTVRVDENNVLHYETGVKVSDTVARYNRLVVPAGGEYRMVLGDGTKVWVNSASELEIPECLQEGERRVRLRGEAYFEVAKDKAHPFRVETAGALIHVLGTKFNVTAYVEDGCVETTLAEGNVMVANGEGQQVVLSPGEQAVAGNGQLDVRNVDVADVISWIDGKFFFRQTPLEDVFKQAERWYGVSVRFEDEELRSIRFSGGMLKSEPVDRLLERVEATGPVRFRVDGQKIVVIKK